MKRMIMIVFGLLLVEVIYGSISFVQDTIKKREAIGVFLQDHYGIEEAKNA